MIFGRKIEVGVDIGTYSLQWAAVDLRTRKSEVWRSPIYPTPAIEHPREGFEFNTRLVSLLSECEKSSKFWSRLAVVGIQGAGVTSGYLEFPKLKDDEIEVAVMSSVSREIPFPLETMDFVHLPVGSLNKGRTAVFYSVWPKSETRRLTSICEACDLRIERIEPTGVALTRELFRNRVLDPDEFYCILNIGHEVTQVVMVKAGYPYYLRDIPIGGKDMTEAISLRRKISFDKAEEIKIDLPLSKLMTSLRGVLSELSREISRTLKYFQRTFHRDRVPQIYLSGGGGLIKNCPAWLEEELGVPVVIEGWEGLKPQEISKTAALNKVALGLALGK